jgi:adenylate cyclase
VSPARGTVVPQPRWADNPPVVGESATVERSGASLVREVRTRLRWLGWIAGAAGAIVVFQSIGFLIPIFLDPDRRFDIGLLNAPVLVAYLLVAGVVVTRHGERHLARALAWIVEGRAPDDREHRLTMMLAVHGVKIYALGWLVGGIVFAALNGFAESWGFAAVVAATIWLGGETTCALVYLASERILRPVTAAALAARAPSASVAPGVRDRLLFVWALGTGVPLLGVLVVGIVGLTKSGVDTQYVAAAGLFLGAVALAAGLLATLFAARAIADPVTSVRAGLERVESGDLEAHVAVDDGSEVGLLQTGFNRMAEGLREREQIRDLFGRQVGHDVAKAALRNGTRLGGEEREVGVLFVDLVGSSSMALAMPPAEVVRLLNLFFRVVVETVEAEGGLVNKFEGDGALCVFGAPVGSEDPAGDALRAARRLAERLGREVPQLDFGIGVSAGRAVAGNVGAEQRFEYTVIGDPVNEAARLSDLAKQRTERLVSCEAALRRARGDESSAWSLGESAVLAGRDGRTELALPRDPATP